MRIIYFVLLAVCLIAPQAWAGSRPKIMNSRRSVQQERVNGLGGNLTLFTTPTKTISVERKINALCVSGLLMAHGVSIFSMLMKINP